MSRLVFKVAVVCLWLVLAAWLVRHEAFPERFEGSFAGYRRMVGRDVLLEDAWMRVLFKDQPMGYSHSSTERDAQNPLHHTSIRSHVFLRLSIMGQPQDVRVSSAVNLDLLARLQDFDAELWTRDHRMRVKGVRVGGQRFRVAVRTGGATRSMAVEIPDDVVIQSPMTQMALRQLSPGQTLTVKTFDPMTLAAAPVAVRALRRETLTVGTNRYDTTVLEVAWRDVRSQTWIDGEGRAVREQTPFGWVLERCTFEQALASVRDATGADLLSGMAVPCHGSLGDPRDADRLRLALNGVEFRAGDFPSDRVTIESLCPTGAVVSIRAGKLPASGGPRETPPGLQAMARPSPSVQSDHAEIRAAAARATAGAADPLERALRIHDWVHRNLEKATTLSVPSALDVLRTRKGDCNEHATLCVALARAAGLPARVIAGLAFHDGAFYYHAWPAMHVGEWIETDPTWGQRAVDAAHIPLAAGELLDQMSLVKSMGRLSITVLDVTPRAARGGEAQRP